MPIYAYRCDDCGHAQDFLQKMSDPLIAACPQCGSKNFAKQLSAPQFQLKGGGWYVTDYAKGSGASPKSEEGKSDSKSETKTEVKATDGASAAPAPVADSKPAAPAATTESK